MSQSLYRFLSTHLSERKRLVFDEVASRRTRHFALVMEDIYQTQNASAILRSAESWGIQDIHVIENDHAFNFHRRISKGAYDWLTIHRYAEASNNTTTCIHSLREKGYRIAITDLNPEAHSPETLPIDAPLAIVLGTEPSGVSDEMRSAADYRIYIPMQGFTESLNVSVAAGVLVYVLMQRLRSSGWKWSLNDEEQLELKIQWARQSIAWSDTLLDLYESGESGLT